MRLNTLLSQVLRQRCINTQFDCLNSLMFALISQNTRVYPFVWLKTPGVPGYTRFLPG